MIEGLKPYPAYKDSDVDWLGKVPAHWDVRRLGSVTQILNGAMPSSSRPEYWAGDIVWVTPDDLGKLKGRYIDNSSRRITQEGYNACGTKLALLGASSYLHAPLSVIWASYGSRRVQTRAVGFSYLKLRLQANFSTICWLQHGQA